MIVFHSLIAAFTDFLQLPDKVASRICAVFVYFLWWGGSAKSQWSDSLPIKQWMNSGTHTRKQTELTYWGTEQCKSCSTLLLFLVWIHSVCLYLLHFKVVHPFSIHSIIGCHHSFHSSISVQQCSSPRTTPCTAIVGSQGDMMSWKNASNNNEVGHCGKNSFTASQLPATLSDR